MVKHSSKSKKSSSLTNTLVDIIHQFENRRSIYSLYARNLNPEYDSLDIAIANTRIIEITSIIALIYRYYNFQN